MKNLTKALAVVMAMTMILGTVAFAAFTDVVADSAYAEAIEVGVALGLYQGYEDSTFKPEGDITRSEFAAIVIRALGQEGQAEGAKGTTMFNDVPATDWAAGYINLAVNQGIIAGYGDGNFGPNDNVTYEQAVKMLVVALGYEPAVGNAGYPVGYLAIADKNKMTIGVNGRNGVAINRGQVAMMVFNSLDVPLMEQSGFGNFIEFVIQDGMSNNSSYKKSLLSEVFNVARLRVIVEKDYTTDSVKKSDLVQIRVDREYNSKFASEYYDYDFAVSTTGRQNFIDVLEGDSGIKSLIGTRAIAYILVDDYTRSDSVVLYATRFISTGQSLEISSTEIEKVTAVGSTHYEIEYYETPNATRTTKATIAAPSTFYMNGAMVASSTANAAWITGGGSNNPFGSFYGSITFTDERDDDSADFDTAVINDYKSMVVTGVNVSAGRVTGEGQASRIIFDPRNTEYTSKLVDIDGKELEWSSLNEGDILALQIVKGNIEATTATLVNKTISGRVTEYDEDADPDKSEYGIGGETYKVVTGALMSTSSMDKLELGDEGTFYLDIMGNIIKFDLEATTASNYAYVVGVMAYSGFDQAAEVKLYTALGEMVTFVTASKVNIDKMTSASVYTKSVSVDAADLTKSGDLYQINKGDLITFSLNSQGRINKISYPNMLNVTTGFREFTASTSDGASSYDYKSESFRVAGGKRVYVDAGTVIMNVASKIKTTTFDSDYEILALSSALDDIDNIESIKAYDVNNSSVARFILITGEVDTTSVSSGVAMLVSSSTTTNAAGDRILRYNVLQNAKQNDNDTTPILASGDLGTSVTVDEGTLFTASLNAKGEIKEGGITSIATIAKTGTVGTSVSLTSALTNISGTNLYSTGGSVTDKVQYGLYNVESRLNSRVTDSTGDAIMIPSNANIYVYRPRAGTNRRVLSLDSINEAFYSETTTNTTVTPSTTTITLYDDVDNEVLNSVTMILRYYDGTIVDAIFYLWR